MPSGWSRRTGCGEPMDRPLVAGSTREGSSHAAGTRQQAAGVFADTDRTWRDASPMAAGVFSPAGVASPISRFTPARVFSPTQITSPAGAVSSKGYCSPMTFLSPTATASPMRVLGFADEINADGLVIGEDWSRQFAGGLLADRAKRSSSAANGTIADEKTPTGFLSARIGVANSPAECSSTQPKGAAAPPIEPSPTKNADRLFAGEDWNRQFACEILAGRAKRTSDIANRTFADEANAERLPAGDGWSRQYAGEMLADKKRRSGAANRIFANRKKADGIIADTDKRQMGSSPTLTCSPATAIWLANQSFWRRRHGHRLRGRNADTLDFADNSPNIAGIAKRPTTSSPMTPTRSDNKGFRCRRRDADTLDFTDNRRIIADTAKRPRTRSPTTPTGADDRHFWRRRHGRRLGRRDAGTQSFADNRPNNADRRRRWPPTRWKGDPGPRLHASGSCCAGSPGPHSRGPGSQLK